MGELLTKLLRAETTVLLLPGWSENVWFILYIGTKRPASGEELAGQQMEFAHVTSSGLVTFSGTRDSVLDFLWRICSLLSSPGQSPPSSRCWTGWAGSSFSPAAGLSSGSVRTCVGVAATNTQVLLSSAEFCPPDHLTTSSLFLLVA